jgi:hypothetical protein
MGFKKAVPVEVMAFRGRLDPLLLKDVGNGGFGTLDAKVLQGADDARIAPGRVFRAIRTIILRSPSFG